MALIHDVLDLARWAPSGDNTQPWRFVVRSNTAAEIHGYDTRAHCVYDLDGQASKLSHGALLENIALAATRFGHRATLALVADDDGTGHVVYRADLDAAAATTPEDPLVAFIERRTVQRRAMRTAPITAGMRRVLEAAAAPFEVLLLDRPAARWKMAALNAATARIRLTIPEAYAVHTDVIAWHSTTSDDRIPDAALGADPLLLATMRFAMASWKRVDFLNRFAGGTLMPRLALDVVPGILCSSHFALVAAGEPASTQDQVSAGRATQRLWLAATALGLQLQPSYTPLVFARYARAGRSFTRDARAVADAKAIARMLAERLGDDRAARTVFLGRLGPERRTAGRSLRLPLDRLIVTTAPRELPRNAPA
jgi:sulfur-carrier protein adenylyltransferase/sulfurtransferase